MASETEHYGLLKLAPGEGLHAGGGRFPNADRDTVDQLLYRFARHRHTGAAYVDNAPELAPDVELSLTGGTLPAGTTIRYVYTITDPDTGESIQSPTASVTTPDPVSAPAAPTFTVQSIGGTLEPGIYFYVLTAWVGQQTVETKALNPVSVEIPAGTSTNEVTLDLPALPTGADGFNIYRRSPSQTRYYYLDTIGDEATPNFDLYVDGGTLTEDSARSLPATNTTHSTNSVTVSVPGATPSIPAGALWTIYRSYTATFGGSSWLVTLDELDLDYLDTGTGTTLGEPPTAALAIDSPSKVLLTDGAEVEGLLPASLVEGLNFDDPITITLEAADEQPVDSWFGDGSLWRFYEFTVTSADHFVAAPPRVVSGATNSGAVEGYVFNAADYVGGTVVAAATELPGFYVEDARPGVDGDGITHTMATITPGDYVLAVGCWDDLDVGTVIDLTATFYGLDPVTTGLPDPGAARLVDFPYTVNTNGALTPFFEAAYRLSRVTGFGSDAIGEDNTVSSRGSLAVGFNNVITGDRSAAVGHGNDVSGLRSTALGINHVIAVDHAVALGQEAMARWEGAVAHATRATSVSGNQQYERVVLGNTGNLRLQGMVVAATVLPAGIVAHVVGTVVAKNSDTTLAKAWDVRMLVAADGAGTPRLVGTATKTVIAEDAGASAWDLTLAVDASGISITPSGLPAGSTTVATLEFTEAIGA